MATASTPLGSDRTSRVVLLISLALNLFFLGLVSAGPVRHLFYHQQRGVLQPSRTAAERIDRLAATLPIPTLSPWCGMPHAACRHRPPAE